MKLATLRDRTRDGTLVVVSRDLTRCIAARPIASTLQQALDDWDHVAPRLEDLARQLEMGTVPWQRFHEHEAHAPLPRAYQWADGSAYVNHVELVRRARGAAMPDNVWSEPLLYQGGSDSFLGPRDRIPLADEGFGADFEAEIAVVTGDVPAGAGREAAASAIRLLMLVNDVSLRELIPGEVARGFGFFQSKPSSAFSPVAVTPDELGPAWDGCRLSGTVSVTLNGRPFGRVDAGRDMVFDFPELIAHAARTRSLGTGSIIGSGTVSNKGTDDGNTGRPVAEGGLGFCCIAEQRAVEVLREGETRTPYLRFGDVVRIEMLDAGGHSVFGAIEQTVARALHEG